MRDIKKIIRIEDSIKEVALREKDLTNSTALFIRTINQGYDLVLYDPKNKRTFAVITISQRDHYGKNYFVTGVAADKGYGPFIYELAMMHLSKEEIGLMPARDGDVREAAFGVWEKFYKRNDVDKITFPSNNNYFRFDILGFERSDFDDDEFDEWFSGLNKEDIHTLNVFNSAYSIEPDEQYKILVNRALDYEISGFDQSKAIDSGSDFFSNSYMSENVINENLGEDSSENFIDWLSIKFGKKIGRILGSGSAGIVLDMGSVAIKLSELPVYDNTPIMNKKIDGVAKVYAHGEIKVPERFLTKGKFYINSKNVDIKGQTLSMLKPRLYYLIMEKLESSSSLNKSIYNLDNIIHQYLIGELQGDYDGDGSPFRILFINRDNQNFVSQFEKYLDRVDSSFITLFKNIVEIFQNVGKYFDWKDIHASQFAMNSRSEIVAFDFDNSKTEINKFQKHTISETTTESIDFKDVSDDKDEGYWDRVKIIAKNKSGLEVGYAILDMTMDVESEFSYMDDDDPDKYDEDEFESHFPDSISAKLEHIEINHKFRGQGFGDELMNAVIKYVKKRDYKTLYLIASPIGEEPRISIDSLTKFYEKYGLKVIKDFGNARDMVTQIQESELNTNFNSWFSGSKVVNSDGSPFIVYHGTSKKFSKFNIKKATQGIIWFTSNKESVEAGEVGAQGRGYVMDLYADIKNPAGWNEYEKYGLGQIESMGYDGVILPEQDGNITGFVFNSEQLKSISNKGDWDKGNKNIFKEMTNKSKLEFRDEHLDKIVNENLQLADKTYFTTGRLSTKVREIIIDKITGGDVWTKLICDIYFAKIQNYHQNENWALNYLDDKNAEVDRSEKKLENDIMKVDDWKKIKLYYQQFKAYNKNVFPISELNSNGVQDIWNLIRALDQRAIILEKIQKLPSVALRNMREDIRTPRSGDEMNVYRDSLEYFLGYYSLLDNRDAELKKFVENKMFKSGVNIEQLVDFVTEKENLLGGKKFDKDIIKDIIENNVELEIIYEQENIMVVEVGGTYGIKDIGCNSLWCFSYSQGYTKEWSTYSYNDTVYIIIDFSEKSDSPDFMNVVIKPLVWSPKNEDEEEINDDAVFDMSNTNRHDALQYIDSVIGLDKAKKLLTFYIEPEEEEEHDEEEEKEFVDPNQLSLFEIRKKIRNIIKENYIFKNPNYGTITNFPYKDFFEMKIELEKNGYVKSTDKDVNFGKLEYAEYLIGSFDKEEYAYFDHETMHFESKGLVSDYLAKRREEHIKKQAKSPINELRSVIANVLNESLIEEELIDETYQGQKDIQKFTSRILYLISEEFMREKARMVLSDRRQVEYGLQDEDVVTEIRHLPSINTVFENGEGYTEIGEFVESANIRVALISGLIGGKDTIKGELGYSPAKGISEEYFKISLRFTSENLKEINDLFAQDPETDEQDIYFIIFYKLYSVLLHELQHAYDAWRSGGKAFGGQEKKDFIYQDEKAREIINSKPEGDFTPEELEALRKNFIAYQNLVHEINARFAQAIQKINLKSMNYNTFDDIKRNWNDVMLDFTVNFDGWRNLSDKMKKKLVRRLAKMYQEEIENFKTGKEKKSKESADSVVAENQVRKIIRETMSEISGRKKIAAGVLVKCVSTESVFLMLRNDSVPKWSLISGGIEGSDVSIISGLKREIAEETQINPSLIDFKFIGIENSPDNNVEFHYYEGTVEEEFIPTIDYENLEYGWFSIYNLPTPLYPGIQEKINKIIDTDIN